MIRIHPIQTGSVRVRRAQLRRQFGGALRVLLDRTWSEWLPIYAWLFEHPEGHILVDTGETNRIMQPNHLPRWHPFFRLATSFDVAPEQELGPRLAALGISPSQIKTVILTHLHTDHAGGLHHVSPATRILATKEEYKTATGPLGKVLGFLPHRWPKWFAPTPIAFQPHEFGPFKKQYPVTQAGDVIIVPTPGHTPHHISVIVTTPELTFSSPATPPTASSTPRQMGRWREPQCKSPTRNAGPDQRFRKIPPHPFPPIP